LLTACGFEVLIPGGMTVAEQIPTLAEAAHVVAPHRTAPHGAGCANVIVCPRNSVFLELRVDSDVQWSMRRTASVVPLRDGCVIGREVAPWRDRPDQVGAWTVDLAQVRAALDAAGD
jgi:capsular polysaccharide biosynthesis protein